MNFCIYVELLPSSGFSASDQYWEAEGSGTGYYALLIVLLCSHGRQFPMYVLQTDSIIRGSEENPHGNLVLVDNQQNKP